LDRYWLGGNMGEFKLRLHGV